MVPRPAAKFPNVARPPLPPPAPPLALLYGDLSPVASRFCCLFIKCEFVVDENFNWMRRTRNVARQLFRTHNSHGNFAPTYFPLFVSISFSFCFAVLLCFECVFCPRKIFISFWQWKCGKCIFNSASDYLFLCTAFFAFLLRYFFVFLFFVRCVLASALIFYFCFEESSHDLFMRCLIWFEFKLREAVGSREGERERVG